MVLIGLVSMAFRLCCAVSLRTQRILHGVGSSFHETKTLVTRAVQYTDKANS